MKVIDLLNKIANGEIPDNCYYKIDEYDGFETIYYSTSEIKEK